MEVMNLVKISVYRNVIIVIVILGKVSKNMRVFLFLEKDKNEEKCDKIFLFIKKE